LTLVALSLLLVLYTRNEVCQSDFTCLKAIILWRSASGLIFVIDGSHRLSSLASWINDDYGDGDISKIFYDGLIPEKQQSIAQRTRSLINKKIGEFKDYQLATSRPDKVRADVVERSKHLGALALYLQWFKVILQKLRHPILKLINRVPNQPSRITSAQC